MYKWLPSVKGDLLKGVALGSILHHSFASSTDAFGAASVSGVKGFLIKKWHQ
jgi:hypothetical protein